MFKGQVIGFLGNDAKKTEKGCTFSVSHNYKEKGVDKTQWISCFINYETNVIDYLKKGTLVAVYGKITVSTYTSKDGEVLPAVTIDVREVDLLPNKSNKE